MPKKYYCIWCLKFHYRGKDFWDHIKYEFKTEEKIQDEIMFNKWQQNLIDRHLKEINNFPNDLKKYMLNPKNRFTIEEARKVAWFPLKIQRVEIIRLIESTKRAIHKILVHYVRRAITEDLDGFRRWNNWTQGEIEIKKGVEI